MKKRIVKIVLCILGVTWLAVTMYFGISMFMGQGVWINKLVVMQGIEPSKKFDGGDSVNWINKKDYNIIIHEPVYDGVFWHSKKPFIQVDWLSYSELPPTIEDTLDVTGDGVPDISVKINTKELSITYKALRDDIKGLIDKGSLSDIRMYTSKNAYDGLFSYHNKKVGDAVYRNGVSIRILFKGKIKD